MVGHSQGGASRGLVESSTEVAAYPETWGAVDDSCCGLDL